MRALVVYESAWGNTRTVAEAVGGVLGRGMAVRVAPVETAPALADVDADLLVVGAPTHAFGLSRPRTRADAAARGGRRLPTGVREWLASGAPPALLAAAFDTHVRRPDLPGHAGRAAAGRLHRLGCVMVVPPESFGVEGYEGPLLPGELARARQWAETIAARVAADARPL